MITLQFYYKNRPLQGQHGGSYYAIAITGQRASLLDLITRKIDYKGDYTGPWGGTAGTRAIAGTVKRPLKP